MNTMQKIDQPILFEEPIGLKNGLLNIQHHYEKVEALIKNYVDSEEALQVGLQCEQALRQLQTRKRVEYALFLIFAIICVVYFAVSINYLFYIFNF